MGVEEEEEEEAIGTEHLRLDRYLWDCFYAHRLLIYKYNIGINTYSVYICMYTLI